MANAKRVISEDDTTIVYEEVKDDIEIRDEVVKDKKKKTIYFKHCEVVCDKDKLKVDLQEVFMKYKTIKQWAYILHDKDDTRPHYHIYLNFGKASISVDLIASWFNIPTNFINRINGKKSDMLNYLTHSTESSKFKHQYDSSEVVSNFDYQTEAEVEKVIGDFKNYTYAEQIKFCHELPTTEQRNRAYSTLKKSWELECNNLILNPDRNLQVVFITGKGGTGKTTYAKRMFENLNYDYSISSSSNDPFQDYLGQRGMILDDLRDRAFVLDDLLKILDNNTNSSVKSRFNNKVFNGKMIVITSSVPLCYWYPKLKNQNSIESLYQLYRRINDYIEVKDDVINIYDGVDAQGKPKTLKAQFPNDLIKSIKKCNKNKIDLTKIFANISKPIQ